jgi:hypothetical protein
MSGASGDYEMWAAAMLVMQLAEALRLAQACLARGDVEAAGVAVDEGMRALEAAGAVDE